MRARAKKTLIPTFLLTETTTPSDPQGTAIFLPSPNGGPDLCYCIRPKYLEAEGNRSGGVPVAETFRFNCFPIVLDSMGVPWGEVALYIISRLKDLADPPSMATYVAIAEDLAAYRSFLDETGQDWLSFPAQKLKRPTYRFRSHLKFCISAKEIAPSTARRRIGSVIGFYRWLTNEGIVSFNYPPWKESDRYIGYKDSRGFDREKKVVTTDLAILVPKQDNPYEGCIDDGGKLRPLPVQEQEWLRNALVARGNTEMTLAHVFGLLTGARIQTILTFRLKDVDRVVEGNLKELRVPVGFGTGIDTKYDKQMVLHIPLWFYKTLQTYANSDRARSRRLRAVGGDTGEQYLFLSAKGAPFYQSKADARSYDELNRLRHVKSGQAVRQFITEKIIPFIRETYGQKTFHYRFHDLRATAGMNWTDHQLKLVELGKTTLKDAREFVGVRMGHESAATTDKYLDYRKNTEIVRWAGDAYEGHLRCIVERAIESGL